VVGRCAIGRSICGPSRGARPANKILLLGPGDYAMTNGKRDRRSVVFRVDVEDRSEPGGANAAASRPVPDADLVRGSGYQRRLEAALGGGLRRSDDREHHGPTPDIDDGGDLFRGNQQIHPVTQEDVHPWVGVDETRDFMKVSGEQQVGGSPSALPPTLVSFGTEDARVRRLPPVKGAPGKPSPITMGIKRKVPPRMHRHSKDARYRSKGPIVL